MNMGQLKIENYDINGLISKVNIKKKKDDETEENVKLKTNSNSKENTNYINEPNGTVEVTNKSGTYKLWKVEFIRPLITKFLKTIYLYSLIAREINKIDSTVFDNQSKDIIPVEMQKTSLQIRDDSVTFRHVGFEQSIRTQLEDNIENYGKCWLFMDSEYLRYLQSGDVGKGTSINLTWIPELMKETTLKVFSIKYDGEVKELTTKDFDFLRDLYTDDERVLNRNKLKIFHNVINGYKFTQEEISQFENEFISRCDNTCKTSVDYFRKNSNKRCKLYGNVLNFVNKLSHINNILLCRINDNLYTQYGVILGLFHQNDYYGGCKNARIQFVDKFNIAQYFPGYLRNKELWDYCKTKQRIFTIDEFRGITEGREHCLKLIKQQSKSLADYD